MDSLLLILKRFHENEVDFVLIGGLAAIFHGSSLVTEDLDVAVPFTEQNAARILRALSDLHPTHRMTPARKPLTETPAQLATFKNLYLVTDLGQVDFLGHVAGLGDFEKVRAEAISANIEGEEYRVLSLEALIRSKEALGRPRDLRALQQLKAILERVKQGKS